ncbi:xanthine dehydrogenase molybdopterin binding subunit [Flocculibacter collagenilyticus]|uniref:xanthine dehydrogenase molybdopterin binding subunit n=1 Tax=Flocculibacter collagenilyticus TaxID=2744479 RepID=UPI0018F5CFE4|nr:xanthine dehydrogenase molybdopterin binding subunit [Flocculibacter collagenilyticus]
MRSLSSIAKHHSKTAIKGGTHKALPHDSAKQHVTGSAIYVDDQIDAANQLHAAIGFSTIAKGKITSLDLAAVAKAPGVIAVITCDDVVGNIDVGPVFKGDILLTSKTIDYHGQPIFAVAATSYNLAQQAVKLANIAYQESTPRLEAKEALKKKSFVRPSYVMATPQLPTSATDNTPSQHASNEQDNREPDHNNLSDEQLNTLINEAEHQLSGQLHIGGQEHFYLEGQVAIAIPDEIDDVYIHSSSQHPTEVQKLVAQVLNVAINKVNVITRRMGGGFGGKETQAAPWACIAAVLASKTKQPVKLRLSRADDMMMTGKRHPFSTDYRVGFDSKGKITALEINLAANCGYSPDLSDAIVDRAMFHSDNSYYLEHAKITGHRCKTNTVSHTAFRGFGGPQGMLVIEAIMDDIARYLVLNPLAVRKRNLYGKTKRNITHYGQVVSQNILPDIINQLEQTSEYTYRRNEILSFNKSHPYLKKGIALTPVKFGISFTVQHLNQAGALVHIYTDGSVQVNTGGTEMGQGLYIKVAQIVAQELQIDIDHISMTATRTDKVPNTSPTAASSGTDLNGKAAQNAVQKIKKRLINFASTHFNCPQEQVTFVNNLVEIGEQTLSFPELIQLAYMHRVSLSATGFYKTPKIHFDRETGKGRPFFYYAYGAAVSEVIIDTLTGESKLLRVDILHDVGSSLNPAVDIGQIEGGFVQGLGWLTSEELMWNEQGKLLTIGPSTYKIPAVSDIPADFRVNLFQRENEENTIYNSKAVGEPPFMLAISVWSAIKDAVSSIADYKTCPPLDTPATPERILDACMWAESWKNNASQQATPTTKKTLKKLAKGVKSGEQASTDTQPLKEVSAPLSRGQTKASLKSEVKK